MDEIQSAPIDILLFGETGCGKSTTVNALANYCRFETFDDAEKGEFSSPIPAQLVLRNPSTGKFDPIDKELRRQEDKIRKIGQSVTQEPKSYEFRFRDRRIRLIDTPGMGDTDGLDADTRNFQKIVHYLKRNFKSLNAICFLIKAFITRETAVFEHTLKQLLLQLDQRACSNIIFLFTYSRNTLYGVGEGFNTVKAFLQNGPLSGQKIQLKVNVNCFFIDNEAFQFLLAQKRGYQYDEDVRASFKKSWNVSVTNITKMLDSIEKNLHPLNVSTDLLSIYYGVNPRQPSSLSMARINTEKNRSYRNPRNSKFALPTAMPVVFEDEQKSTGRRRSKTILKIDPIPVSNHHSSNQQSKSKNTNSLKCMIL